LYYRQPQEDGVRPDLYASVDGAVSSAGGGGDFGGVSSNPLLEAGIPGTPSFEESPKDEIPGSAKTPLYLTLKWSRAADATGYMIYRRGWGTPASEYAAIGYADQSATEFRDYGGQWGRYYHYKIVSVRNGRMGGAIEGPEVQFTRPRIRPFIWVAGSKSLVSRNNDFIALWDRLIAFG